MPEEKEPYSDILTPDLSNTGLESNLDYRSFLNNDSIILREHNLLVGEDGKLSITNLPVVEYQMQSQIDISSLIDNMGLFKCNIDPSNGNIISPLSENGFNEFSGPLSENGGMRIGENIEIHDNLLDIQGGFYPDSQILVPVGIDYCEIEPYLCDKVIDTINGSLATPYTQYTSHLHIDLREKGLVISNGEIAVGEYIQTDHYILPNTLFSPTNGYIPLLDSKHVSIQASYATSPLQIQLGYDGKVTLASSSLIPSLREQYPHSTESTLERQKPSKRMQDARMLIRRLTHFKHTSKTWKKYEDLCSQALYICWEDSLQEPKSQYKTKDGSKIYDIIFRIEAERTPSWDDLVRRTDTSFLVVECKDLKNSIKGRDVSQLFSYLRPRWGKTLGAIIFHHPPEKSAFSKREQYWHDYGVMILFIATQDLIKMLDMVLDGKDASSYLNDICLDFMERE